MTVWRESESEERERWLGLRPPRLPAAAKPPRSPGRCLAISGLLTCRGEQGELVISLGFIRWGCGERERADLCAFIHLMPIDRVGRREDRLGRRLARDRDEAKGASALR